MHGTVSCIAKTLLIFSWYHCFDCTYLHCFYSNPRECDDLANKEAVLVEGPRGTLEVGACKAVCVGGLSHGQGSVETTLSSWILNTGLGVVWSMDWAPYDEENNVSFLAVGCHPQTQLTHNLNAIYSGRNAIQIWKFPDSCVHAAKKKNAAAAPRLAMNLLHDGGPTWCLSWCPTRVAAETGEKVGLLAAVLGDGRVCIWDVPLGIECDNTSGPSTFHVEPVASIGMKDVDGSIPCTVDWLPHSPHDLLLVGYRDGCVSIIRLLYDVAKSDGKEKLMEVVQYFPAEVLSLTSAKWFPMLGDACDVHGIERHTFVTSGHESAINVWDSRFEYSPRVSVRSNTPFTIQDMCWTTHPLGIMVGMEDGTLRGYLMDSVEIKRQIHSGRPTSLITYRGNLPGSMWSIEASVPSILTGKGCQTIAYGGEDGVIGILGNTSYPYVSKKRKEKDIPLVGLWSEGQGKFRLLSKNDLLAWQQQGGLYQGSLQDRKKVLKETRGVMTDVLQTIYSIKWSKRPTRSEKVHGQWLAYGNACGIIHCLWIPSQPDM